MKFTYLLALSFTMLITEQSLAQSTPTNEKGWYTLSNAPGWRGFGSLNKNGWLVPERFENIYTKQIQEMKYGEEAKQAATAAGEELGPDQQVYIAEYGGDCVAQQVLKGAPDAIGKWRVKYKVNTPTGTAVYTAQGYGAQSYNSHGQSFLNWLNGVRASYGLGAVGYDPNLESWAAVNNDQQAARGLGHHVMGPARRQNSAMGGFPGIESMWMASPAHRAALLDPTISWIGIAGAGAWWTFNAN